MEKWNEYLPSSSEQFQTFGMLYKTIPTSWLLRTYPNKPISDNMAYRDL